MQLARIKITMDALSDHLITIMDIVITEGVDMAEGMAMDQDTVVVVTTVVTDPEGQLERLCLLVVLLLQEDLLEAGSENDGITNSNFKYGHYFMFNLYLIQTKLMIYNLKI